MRHHMGMHLGLLAAVMVIFVLQAVGVAVPTAVLYLVVLACPLMMISMMRGHDHGTHHSTGPADTVDQGSPSGRVEPGPGAQRS